MWPNKENKRNNIIDGHYHEAQENFLTTLKISFLILLFSSFFRIGQPGEIILQQVTAMEIAK